MTGTTPADIDAIIESLERHLERMHKADGDGYGGLVQLRKAEMDLNLQMGRVRDAMLEAVTVSKRMGRSGVDNLFGSNCMRIARIRHCLQSVQLSGAMGGNELKEGALQACQAVEGVLMSMGHGSRLQAAQQHVLREAARREQMQQSTAIDEQVNVMLKELGIDPVIGMSGVLHLRELKRSKSSSRRKTTGRIPLTP